MAAFIFHYTLTLCAKTANILIRSMRMLAYPSQQCLEEYVSCRLYSCFPKHLTILALTEHKYDEDAVGEEALLGGWRTKFKGVSARTLGHHYLPQPDLY
jgi:hypothetical protein